MKNSHISWTVNIQLNKWNTKNQVEFTINTGIFCEKVSAILNGELSTTFPIEVHSMLRIRLSEIKNSTDHWYKITVKTDLETLFCTMPQKWFYLKVHYYNNT
ncbi:DUF4304 domain-containing protein [Bacillus sp. AFS053548]|uniref:DUF4304 domain-containing protein n=1 Tax=Bacillus sp. AFS053548 TaxID=2033505 RepID=UPI000BFB686E|nr:hypothetical protein CN946_00800 [Bacillus sp. AFS053548]